MKENEKKLPVDDHCLRRQNGTSSYRNKGEISTSYQNDLYLNGLESSPKKKLGPLLTRMDPSENGESTPNLSRPEPSGKREPTP